MRSPTAKGLASRDTPVMPLRTGKLHAGEHAVLRPQILQLGFKADVRPQGGQLLTEVLEDGVEIVRSHMGLGFDEDVGRRTTGDQLLQDEAVAEVLGAGRQLAIGKGSGSALAKLDVAGRVQLAGGPEALHIGLAGLYGTAPFQENGPL